MKVINCGIDGKSCDIGICKRCDKHSQEEITIALVHLRNQYLEVMNRYTDFNSNCTRKYIPSCKYGRSDCVYDEEYIKSNHPYWYKDLCNQRESDDWCPNCINGNEYDDEDK
jgi:hypothetical protein